MRYPRFAFAAALALVVAPSAWSQPQAELVLHFVEIGQGDCTLIQCPNGIPYNHLLGRCRQTLPITIFGP